MTLKNKIAYIFVYIFTISCGYFHRDNVNARNIDLLNTLDTSLKYDSLKGRYDLQSMLNNFVDSSKCLFYEHNEKMYFSRIFSKSKDFIISDYLKFYNGSSSYSYKSYYRSNVLLESGVYKIKNANFCDETHPQRISIFTISTFYNLDSTGIVSTPFFIYCKSE
jgi:hypothetical protein